MLKKSAILIAEDEDDIREILVMEVESEFDCEVIEAATGPEAINALKQYKNIAVVISDYHMPGSSGGDLYQEVRKYNTIPFILISSESPSELREFQNFETDHLGNKALIKPFEMNELKVVLQQVIEHTTITKETNRVFQQSYFRINTKTFCRHYVPTLDIYLKIGEENFVKIQSSVDPIGVMHLKKYIDKGLEYFYLDKESFSTFLKQQYQNVNQLKNKKYSKAYKPSITNCVEKLGIPERIVKKTDQVLKDVKADLANNRSLKQFIEKLFIKEGHIGHRNQLMFYLCGVISESIHHFSLKKFVSSIAFSDVLIGNDSLSRITSINTKLLGELNPEDRLIFKEHIPYALDLLTLLNNVDFDERDMIQNHHEKPDGAGFPRGIDASQLSPMASAFILALDFAQMVLAKNTIEDINTAAILNELGEAYQKNHFKKSFQALQENLH